MQTTPDKLKVLMLGWEASPQTGGLGKVNQILSEKLKEKVDLTFIHPTNENKATVFPSTDFGGNPPHVPTSFLKQTDRAVVNRSSLDPYFHFEASCLSFGKDGGNGSLQFFSDPLPPVFPHSGEGKAKQQSSFQPEKKILPPQRTDQAQKNKPSWQATFEALKAETQPSTQVEKVTLRPKEAEQVQKVREFTQEVFEASKAQPFDLIHAHDWATFPAAAELKKRTGKPFIAHIHSTEAERAPEKLGMGLTAEVEKEGLALADQVITVSETTAQKISALYGVPEEKIQVVYHGISLKTQLCRELNPQSPTVLFAGRLTSQKGVRYLVETARQLVEFIPTIRFVVAGAGEEMRPAMLYARQKGISDHFVFTGFLEGERLEEAFSRADVFFLPSVAEPFGMAALEAISRQVPVVISESAGVTEVVQHLLKAPFHATATFAHYLYALLQYPALRKSLVENAFQEIRGMTWEKSTEAILATYQSIMEK